MYRMIALVLVLGVIAVVGWRIHAAMRDAREERRIARERAHQASEWQKMLDRNAAKKRGEG